MSQNNLPARARLARQIIVSHGLLMAMVIIFYILNGFLDIEWPALLALLAPLTSLYAGTFFRHLAASIRDGGEAKTDDDFPQSALVSRLIAAHFVAMAFLLSAKALFNWIEFPTMLVLMSLVETGFGSYMGAVLSAVFGLPDDKAAKK